jgi:hypothetical protein
MFEGLLGSKKRDEQEEPRSRHIDQDGVAPRPREYRRELALGLRGFYLREVPLERTPEPQRQSERPLRRDVRR